MHIRSGWIFFALAAIPCAALFFFCGVAVYEWWLISSGQIAVIPRPTPGVSSVPNVPASRLFPLIFGSGALAALFAYALLRRSRRVLVIAYLAVILLIAVPFIRRML